MENRFQEETLNRPQALFNSESRNAVQSFNHEPTMPVPDLTERIPQTVLTLKKRKCQGTHGRRGTSTVAAFRPWRGSQVHVPWALARTN